MATTPAVGARASGHDRRLWILIAAAVAALVSVFVLHSALSGQESAEQEIGEQVYAGDGCLSKVSSNQRVARRWPQASKAEVIVCQTSESDAFANHVMDYAQFESAIALSAMLKTAPPDGSYCTIGSAVVVLAVAPGDELLRDREVVARAADAEDQVLHAAVLQAHRLLAHVSCQPRRHRSWPRHSYSTPFTAFTNLDKTARADLPSSLRSASNVKAAASGG